MDLEARVRDLLARGEHDEAAEAVIDELGPSVLGYLCSQVGDDDDAADVFSAWEEDVWKGLPGFRFECSLRTWAYRLAYHAAARFRRDGYRRRREPLPSSAASRLAVSVASSALPYGRTQTLRRLRGMLDPGDRTLLILRIDKGLTWEEVAVVLSAEGAEVDPAALRKRFERLKYRLVEMARREGLLE